MIEQELSILNEDNEKEALRSYFSINDQIELKQGDKGDIVTALQDFLIEKSTEEPLSAVEEITTAIEAMGEPDGNIGPKSVTAIKAFRKHFELEETGVYNSVVHEAIAGPAPVPETPEAVETDGESGEQKAPEDPEKKEEDPEKKEAVDFPHPKWDALENTIGQNDFSELSSISSEEAGTIVEEIITSFRTKLIDFVKDFKLNMMGSRNPLQIDMKRAIVNKFSPRRTQNTWISIENIEETFNTLVDEKSNDDDFDIFENAENSRSWFTNSEQDLKDAFAAEFINAEGEFAPSVSPGDFFKISGIEKLQAVYTGISEIIEKWDDVNSSENTEAEKDDLSESVSLVRFQKLAGI
jgi:peptidoglycan hydrolase-like protein with peptidoglycan-binding domain